MLPPQLAQVPEQSPEVTVGAALTPMATYGQCKVMPFLTLVQTEQP